MEFNEEDGHWRVTIDLADGKINLVLYCSIFIFICPFCKGIYHYQYKVVTKSWFEQEPEQALPEYKNDEAKSKIDSLSFILSDKYFILSCGRK
jgi:hypothetical protein